MTTTWSTTDKSASPTLSGGNLVVSFTINSMAGIRSADRVYSGKYYWENTFTSNNGTAIGICAGTANLAALDTTVLGSLVVEVIGVGGIWNNGSSTGASVGGTITSGWIACVALDATNGRVWFRNGAAGNWNGSASANPATGVGGINISGWASAGLTGLYACASGSLGSTSITANFGASAFTGAVPAGFTSGFPDSTTLLNVAANTQMLVEEWGAPNPAAQLTQLLVEEWAVVVPPPFTSWSPADKSTNLALSGSNLTATSTAAGTNSVRSVDKQITAKSYWECTYNVAGSTGTGAGIHAGWMSIGSLGSYGSSPNVGTCGLTVLGTVYRDGLPAGVAFGAVAAGSVVCIAFDPVARLIWFRVGAAGNWNASATANPATGAGGVALTNLGGGIQYYASAVFTGNGDQITANFGDTAFAGVVPSGFTAGFTARVVSPSNELATQVGAEQWASMIPPQMQATQAAIEQWTSTANVTTRMLMTQEAIEQWSTVAVASAITARQAALTVVT